MGDDANRFQIESTPRDVLETAFVRALNLPPMPARFLLDLWDMLQGLDDWVDDTPTTRAAQLRTVWLAVVGLHGNPFAHAHASDLLPVLASLVMRWQAANIVEVAGERDQLPKAYMWRAGFYDVVLQVVLLVHGPDAALEAAPAVMRLYGERLDEYLKEFHDA